MARAMRSRRVKAVDGARTFHGASVRGLPKKKTSPPTATGGVGRPERARMGNARGQMAPVRTARAGSPARDRIPLKYRTKK